MNAIYYVQTTIGKIGVVADETAITRLYFEGENAPGDLVEKETSLLHEAGSQLQSYLAGQRRQFTVPLAPAGTPYLRQVWNRLCTIPYGQTRSYREIAQELGNPRAARAVGLANHINPLPIFIPCHRVIGANGNLTGYRGGLELKAHLLELEKRHALL